MGNKGKGPQFSYHEAAIPAEQVTDWKEILKFNWQILGMREVEGPKSAPHTSLAD